MGCCHSCWDRDPPPSNDIVSFDNPLYLETNDRVNEPGRTWHPPPLDSAVSFDLSLDEFVNYYYDIGADDLFAS